MMPDTSNLNNTQKKEYILNEVGIEIARENVAKQIKEVLDNKGQEGFKEKLLKLMKDRYV